MPDTRPRSRAWMCAGAGDPAVNNYVSNSVPVIPGGTVRPAVPVPPPVTDDGPVRDRRIGAFLIFAWLLIVAVCVTWVASCMAAPAPLPSTVSTPTTYGPPALAGFLTLFTGRRWRASLRSEPVCDYCARAAEHSFRAVTTRGRWRWLRLHVDAVALSCDLPTHMRWAAEAAGRAMRSDGRGPWW